MNELIVLLTEWQHWAFEVISGGVFFAAGLLVPERYNPFKRLVARHDREKHGFGPDNREARMAALDAWLDHLDEEFGEPSLMAVAEAREWLQTGTRPTDTSAG